MENLLKSALKKSEIKDSTFKNVSLWLQPSFAEVKIDGVKVKDFISNLVNNKNWNKLDDAFYKINSFGTAGVRGKLAIGTANFNRIILGLGVEAHARYISAAYDKNGIEFNREKAVILAYDSRKGSYDPESKGPGFLVKEAASIYCAHKIKVYLFDTVAPTPELSFAIFELENIRPYSGGVFTASHNPASDNGFKPYDYYGGQVVHKEVQKIADSINDYADVKKIDYDEALKNGMIQIVGEEIDSSYIEKENQTAVWIDNNGHFLDSKIDNSLKIVFSALNGTAQRLIFKVLERRGFNMKENFHPVEKQCVPDGAFPTCLKPNPEEKEALNESIRLANKVNADILMATDPDSDRIGVGVLISKDEIEYYSNDHAVKDGYYLLSGNQQLVLLTDYILSQTKERDGKLPENSVIGKSIVSTDLAKEIADQYGVMTIEPHVGFKYLGEKLYLYANKAFSSAKEKDKNYRNKNYVSLSRKERINVLQKFGLCFLFGGEESNGSLVGDYVKDKDAVTITAMFTEMAGFYKKNRITLTQRLEQIYKEYGYAREETISLNFTGAAGNDVINKIMSDLRKNPFQKIADKNVLAVIDYKPVDSSGTRYAKDINGNILYDDSEPSAPEKHTGYTEVNGVKLPLFWHGDYKVINKAAKLPEANMIIFVLFDGSKVIVRPSGTEPKIKFYVLAKGSKANNARTATDSFFNMAREELTCQSKTVEQEILNSPIV